MQKLTIILAAAALLAGPSFAQDAKAPAAAAAPAVTADVPRDHNGNPLELPTLKSLYDTAQFTTADVITAATDLDKIYVVKLSQLKKDDTQADASADPSGIDKLKSSLTGNAAVTGKVTEAGLTVDDIVAVRSSPDGGLIVFVDDRAM